MGRYTIRPNVLQEPAGTSPFHRNGRFFSFDDKSTFHGPSGDNGRNEDGAEIRCKIPRHHVQDGVSLDCFAGVENFVHRVINQVVPVVKESGSIGNRGSHAGPQ